MTNFDCEYSYDAHGNILTSSRNGLLSNGQYGNLGTTTMIYNGNQLSSCLARVLVDFEQPVFDSDFLPIGTGTFPGAFERLRFSYDSNGNMISSIDADMAHIEYNYLNLPQNISRSSASLAQASYTYDSDGNRLNLVYRDSDNNLTTVNWCGNLVYVNGELDKILFDGGFIRNGEYYFFATDHLGSIRAVTDSQGNILQTTHYYPYGEEFADSSSSLDFQPYKFTGKEDQSYAGIPMTYFGARFLAHPYSQWTSIDPLAEKYYSLSPYNYCGGNPVNAVDPDGREVIPKGEKELNMIRSTVRESERGYIQVNKNGCIDLQIMEMLNDPSSNFSRLLRLVKSDINISVNLSDTFVYLDRDGELRENGRLTYCGADPFLADLDFKSVSGLTTGECGNYGKTLFPDNDGYQNSSTHGLEIYIHPSLSDVGAAEAFSHEAYGHTLLYLENGLNHMGASHKPNGFKETNYVLKQMILSARRETVKNF